MHKTLIVVAVVALVATGAAQAGNDCPPPPCKYNCQPPVTPPPVTPPPVTPPPAHDCTYTGAGKDGQPGNDDCAPLPVPPTVAPPTVVPPVTVTPAQVVVQTVTVQAPPKIVTRVVTHTKVKTVIRYKTRVVVKHKTVTKTKCSEGSRMFHGKCHAIVKGSG
jgi:hypothetical protein